MDGQWMVHGYFKYNACEFIWVHIISSFKQKFVSTKGGESVPVNNDNASKMA